VAVAEKQTLMKTTPRFWSNVFDALIVVTDLLLGNFLVPWFTSVFNSEKPAPQSSVSVLCMIILMLLAMYVAGLLINRPNFRAEKKIELSGGDNIALMFNMVLLAAIFPLVVIELFPAATQLFLVIVMTFGFMGGWVWLHWYILKKESPRNEGTPSLKRKIAGFFLVFPFVMMLALPAGVVSSEMELFSQGEEISVFNAVGFPLFMGLILAFLAWSLYFVPRKMMKSFLGVNLRSRYFFWGLVLSYAFKLSSINFIQP